jgi:signal transduction histidine kinase
VTAALIICVIAVLGLARRVVADHQRMQLIAEAEHELRGPLQAIALAADADARRPDAACVDLRPELERARIALADLAAARSGRRADAETEPVRLDRLVWRTATASDLAARRAGGGVHLDWSAGPVTIHANRGRLAQALGNLLANAVEHGGGHVCVVGRRTTRGVRVEVRDSGRGRGLAIAAKAVRDSGGRLTAAKAGTGTAVAIELPLADAAPDAPATHPRDPAPTHPRDPAPTHPRDPAPTYPRDPGASADPPAAA